MEGLLLGLTVEARALTAVARGTF
jgi:hypothetical protein